jgi:hypothetical protein
MGNKPSAPTSMNGNSTAITIPPIRNNSKNLNSVSVIEPPTAPTTVVQMPNNKNKTNNSGVNVIVKENKKNKGVIINVKPNVTEQVMAGGKRKTRKHSKKSRKAKKTRKH